MFTVLAFWLSLEFDYIYRKLPKQLNTKTCKEFVKIESWVPLCDLFDMLTQAIKCFKLHCLTNQRGQMFNPFIHNVVKWPNIL